MKYKGTISDPKDLVTKEWVEDAVTTKVPVTDVKVNGTTVVTDKVANISIKTLQPMKESWTENSLTCKTAAALMLSDGVSKGEGYLGTVYWDDLPQGMGCVECKAFVISASIIQFEITSSNTKPYTWFYNSAQNDATWRTYVPLNDTVTSTSTVEALTAHMGKELQDQISNLKNIGRFLAIWDCSTGLPLTDPTESPYTYKTGDYYRVGTVSTTTNYKPNGSTYTSRQASTTVESDTVEVGYVYYYDGNQWLAQSAGGGGTVQDVQINGGSIVSAETGIANIPNSSADVSGVMTSTQYTKLEGIEAGAQVNDVTDVQVNGTSVLSSGIANIPIATQDAKLGVVQTSASFGVSVNSSGMLNLQKASEAQLIAKNNAYNPIVGQNLNIAVREGLGNNSLTWSDAYKASARNTIGAGTPYTVTVDV